METITMMARYDLEKLKNIAKHLFGIKKTLKRYERPTVTPRKQLEKYKDSKHLSAIKEVKNIKKVIKYLKNKSEE